MQESVSDLALEVETSRSEVSSSEAALREWEERLRACRTTREAVGRARGREGEMEALRAEVRQQLWPLCQLCTSTVCPARKKKEILT